MPSSLSGCASLESERDATLLKEFTSAEEWRQDGITFGTARWGSQSDIGYNLHSALQKYTMQQAKPRAYKGSQQSTMRGPACSVPCLKDGFQNFEGYACSGFGVEVEGEGG